MGPSASSIQSRLIGEILVERGLITAAQLDEAIEHQEATGERLGEIVVARFEVSRLELAGVLAEQWAELEDAERAAPSVVAPQTPPAVEPTPADAEIRRPIGEIFLEFGYASNEQLDAALEVQRTTGARLGEVLVEQGVISRVDLASALAEQWSSLQKLRPPTPAPEPTPWQNGAPSVERTETPVSVGTQPEASGPTAAEVELDASLRAVRIRVEALEALSVGSDLDALRAEVAGLKDSTEDTENMAGLREAVERLETRPDQTAAIEAFASELSALASRLDEVAARDDTSALDELRSRFEELQAGVPSPGASIGAEPAPEVDLEPLRREVAELREAMGAVAEIAELRATIQALDVPADPSDRIEAAVAEIAALSTRLDELPAVGDLQGARAALELRTSQRLGELAAERAESSGIDELRSRVDRLRKDVDDTAVTKALEERLGELEQRLGDVVPAAELHEGLKRLAESSSSARESLAEALFARVEKITAIVPHEDELSAIRVQVEALAARPSEDVELRVRVHNLALRVEELAGAEGAVLALRAAVEELGELRVSDALATGARFVPLERAVEDISRIETNVLSRVESDLAKHAEGVHAVSAQLDELRHAADARGASVDVSLAEAARRREAGEHELGKRLGEGLDALREDLESRTAELAPELEQQSRLVEELREQLADLQQAARARNEWEAKIEGTVESRLAGLAGQVVGQIAAAQTEAREASSELRDANDVLRASVDQLAERIGGHEVNEGDAREALRAELERVASSTGWRLERIEESLAAADTAELKDALADIELRLDGVAQMGEEQTRATERALRKGLASLGERLAGTEAEYVEAGAALRRSIERLGAAVVEADARMANQIPVSAEEGCVAFAPTPDGYRLVELPGPKPEIGSTVEVDGCDGAFVVTRFGRSPLPLDSRACAYLDHA